MAVAVPGATAAVFLRVKARAARRPATLEFASPLREKSARSPGRNASPVDRMSFPADGNPSPPESGLFSLRGRRALITGSGQGIGLTLARGLAAAGAELVLNDLDAARMEKAMAGLRAEGATVGGRCFNVSKEAEVVAGVTSVEAEFGPIDILINNAGIHRRSPLETMPLEDWQAVLDVNLTSAFLVTRAVVPGMIRRGRGKIINLCSLNSEISRPTIGNYAAAKGGLKMLTRAMAVEWARHNIQANALAPGYIRTELTGPLTVDPAFNRHLCTRTPAGRWGEPHELVGATVFLASRASDFMNGQLLFVDGGLLAAL